MNKIVLSGGISRWEVSARSVRDQIKNMEGELTVEISSFGGDFYEGMEIFNALRTYSKEKGKVTTIATAKAMSSGSHIFLAGDTRKAHSNATIMCHCAWTFAMGNAHDMTREARILDGIDGIQAAMYAKYQDRSADEVKADMRNEMWYIGEEQLLSSGFIDEIITSDEAPVSMGEMQTSFNTYVSEFKAQALENQYEANLDEVEDSIKTCKGNCTLASMPSTEKIANSKKGETVKTAEEYKALLDTANTTIEANKTDMDGKDQEIAALKEAQTSFDEKVNAAVEDKVKANVNAAKENFKTVMAMAYSMDAPVEVAELMADCSTEDEAKKVCFDAMQSNGVTFGGESNETSTDGSWENVVKTKGDK